MKLPSGSQVVVLDDMKSFLASRHSSTDHPYVLSVVHTSSAHLLLFPQKKSTRLLLTLISERRVACLVQLDMPGRRLMMICMHVGNTNWSSR
jgi:hypothetical protein